MMLSSKMLKTFVKMHEHKLNAKISGIQASRLESQFHSETAGYESDEHWNLAEGDAGSRRRPKSHYFNFILTASHQ